VRSCSDACGTGVQTCHDGFWGTCQVASVTLACSNSCGTGTKVCKNGAWTECDAPARTSYVFAATLRDFHSTHPDFEEDVSGDYSDPGIVSPVLGNDDTPIYAHTGGTLTVTSPDTFAQWYHDVPGVNLAVPYQIALSPSASQSGSYAFDGMDFFPLDDDPRGFGNEGNMHDYDFTLVATANFRYLGGEWFRFTADDDLWVFVNRHLALDLGGLHEPKPGEIDLDDVADELGISPGHAYPIHLFFAERHTIGTDLSIETNVTGLAVCQ
jgi:fibro-slime domain-containing protein